MKRLITCFVLILMCKLGANAQLPGTGDMPLEVTADDNKFERGLASADGNVVIRYDDILIYCDHTQYNPEAKDILVQGNVRIYREGRLFTGERAVYNLETKQLTAADFRGDFTPFRFAAESVNTLGTNAYLVKEGIFTTSDNSKPDYYVKAKTARVYPKDRIIFSNVKLYIGRTPIFWFPYLYQSLDKDRGFLITPGYNSIWGAFLLGQYSFPIGEVGAKLRLDLLSDRGVGLGFDAHWADDSKLATKTAEKNDETESVTDDGTPAEPKMKKKGSTKGNWGRFRSYYINDSNPGLNKTAQVRGPIAPDRYRVSFQNRTYLTEDIYASVDINKLSDSRYLQDFNPNEARTNPNPDNAISLTKWDEEYTGTFLVRKNLNEEFYDQVERLPEASFDKKRAPLLGSNFFYDSNTSAGYYNRNFAGDSLAVDYGTFRADTFHQISYPGTYLGWLSFIPKVGLRGTYYQNGGFLENEVTTTTTTTITTTIPATVDPSDPNKIVKPAKIDVKTSSKNTTLTTTSSVPKPADSSTSETVTTLSPTTKKPVQTVTTKVTKTSTIKPQLAKTGSTVRTVANAGFETSFKISRAYEQVQSRAWGLDGLRHVIQPYANFSYAYSSKNPLDLPQFDRLNVSTQLPPIDFPQFNTIDSIDSWAIMRLGMRNRLQTRRDNSTINWLEMDTFVDVNIDRPGFLNDPTADTGTFSNVFNRLRWNPLPWVGLAIDSQLPLLDVGFTEVNTSVNFFATKNSSFSIGHRYINGDSKNGFPIIENSNALNVGGYLRLNDNWAFGFRENYELTDHTLQSQSYQVYRDLSSWVASLGVVVQDNKSSSRNTSSFGMILTFTLKDIPNVRLPLNLDPESLIGGGSGTGKNK